MRARPNTPSTIQIDHCAAQGVASCMAISTRLAVIRKTADVFIIHFADRRFWLSLTSLSYSVVFPSARTFAHLALAAAEIAALPALLMRLFPFLGGLESVASVPLILAHLARCAAAILALVAADLRCFFGAFRADGDGASLSPPPAMDSIWL